jgi:glyoxylase-like metal-dependent hydrolase (beta-lactamase superfamily II)
MKRAVLIALAALTLTACARKTSSFRAGSREVRTFRHAYADTHLVPTDDGGWLMIDSGGPDDAARLEDDLIDAKIAPKDIRAIVVTHGHWDHAGGARHFEEKYGTPVIAGAGDEGLLQRGVSDDLCPTSSVSKLREHDDETKTFPPPKDPHFVAQETTLEALHVKLPGFVRPVPDHTEGSVVIVVQGLPMLVFVGDMVRGSIIGSGAATHLYNCDLQRNHEAMRSLVHEMPKDTVFVPGHFGNLSPRDLEEALGPFLP